MLKDLKAKIRPLSAIILLASLVTVLLFLSGKTVHALSYQDLYDYAQSFQQGEVLGAATPPTISNVSLTADATSASASWVTDQLSTSRLNYATSNVSSGTFVTQHALTVNGLTPDTVYHYDVSSTNQQGSTTTTPIQTFTTLPSAPAALSATSTSISAISLTWNDSDSGITGYGIYRCQGNGCIPSFLLNTGPTNNYTDSGLSAATTYTYEVSATGIGGVVSALSSPAFATTQTTNSSPPSPPTNLQASLATSTQWEIDLTWTPSTDPSYNQSQLTYTLYNNGSPIGTTAAGATSYSATGLNSSTNYNFTVRAKDIVGNTSDPSTVITMATPPANVPAVYGPTYQQLQINFNWFDQNDVPSNVSKSAVVYSDELDNSDADIGTNVFTNCPNPSASSTEPEADKCQVDQELDADQGWGVKAVLVIIANPALEQSFYNYQINNGFKKYFNSATAQGFINFYAALSNDIHSRGMKMIVEANDMLADPTYISPTMIATNYWNSFTQGACTGQATSTCAWPAYVAVRQDQADIIATKVKPDLLIIQSEPDQDWENNTDYINQFQDVPTDAAMVQQIATAIENDPNFNHNNTKLGAGALVSNVNALTGPGMQFGQTEGYFNAFFAISQLDDIDSHLYYVGGTNYQTHNLGTDPLAEAEAVYSLATEPQYNNKTISMAEFWPHETLSAGGAGVGGYQYIDLNATDEFSFWNPLYQQFLATMVRFANYEKLQYLSPYNTRDLVYEADYSNIQETPCALSPYDSSCANTDYGIDTTNLFKTLKTAGPYSETGTYYAADIAQYTSTSSPPAITSFTASPSTISYGQSSTLSWAVTGNPAPTLSISPSPGAVSGSSVSVSPTVTTTYTLTATNGSNPATAQATVTVNPNPDTTPPTASITSPSQGTVSGTITFSASASDPTVPGQVTSGLKTLTLLVDGNPFATTTQSSISQPLNTQTLTNTTHQLTASSTDNAGNSFATNPVTITVNNAPAAKYPRKFTLTSLQGLSAITTYPTATATIISASSGATLETQVLSPDTSHNYTVTFLSSDPQMVNIRIKVPGYLSYLFTSIDTTVNSPTVLSVPQMLAADFNNDNIVNSLDYSLMNSHWLTNYPTADINADGIINSLDFAILQKNFGMVGE